MVILGSGTNVPRAVTSLTPAALRRRPRFSPVFHVSAPRRAIPRPPDSRGEVAESPGAWLRSPLLRRSVPGTASPPLLADDRALHRPKKLRVSRQPEPATT